MTALAAACLYAAGGRAEELSLTAAANRTQIYVGESVLLTVRVGGASSCPEPDLSAVQGFDVRPLGSQSDSRQTLSIINGQVRRESFQGRVFTYELAAQRPGTLTAGPVRVTVAGRVLTAPGPAIVVAGVEEQDWVKVQVEASDTAVLVDQPFDITLAVLILALPPPHADHDPIYPGEPPHIEADYLRGGKIDGLEVPDVVRTLQDCLAPVNRAGLTLNDYTTQGGPLGGFMGLLSDRTPARFAFPRAAVERAGRRYHAYRLSFRYVPKREGSHTFGPVVFKGSVITAVNDAGNIRTQPVFAVGPAVAVRVTPPPEEGRPEAFIGAVGTNLVVEAALDAQTCNVGDPLTLTLSVSGDVSRENLTPPDLTADEAVTRDFRVYAEPRTDRSGEAVKFIYTLRPVRAGTLELPALPLAYYDVRARAYRTAHTRPLPVRANASAEVAESIIINTVSNRPGQEPGGSSWDRSPAAITLSPAGARNDPLGLRPEHVWLALAGPAVFALAAAGLATARLGRAAARRLRPRRRLAAALQRLDNLPAGDPAAAQRRIGAALLNALEARAGLPPSSLTPGDAADELARSGIEPDLAARYAAAIERHFNAAYAGAAAAPPTPADVDGARDLLRAADRSWRRPAGRRRAAAAALAILVAGAAAAARAAEGDAAGGHLFLWDRANALMATASSRGDFVAAAEAYQKLCDAGVRNGPLLFNLGTALLQAGQYDRAREALLRAERHLGSTPDIRRNLRLCEAQGDPARDASLPWYRAPLFWHFAIPLRFRLAAACAGATLLWIALTLRVLGRRPAARAALRTAVCLLALFGTSAAASLYLEHQALGGDRALLNTLQSAAGKEDAP